MSSSSTHTRSTIGRLLIAFPLFLFLGAMGFIIVLGFSSAWINYARLVRSRPMSATIIDKQNVKYVRDAGTTRRITTTVYRPIIVYEYQINGQRYENNRIWPTRLTVESEWAAETLKRYEIGQNYQGFYDPSNPAESFLIKEFDGWTLGGSVFSSLIFITLSAMLVRHILKGNARRI